MVQILMRPLYQPEYHLIVTEGTDTEPEYFGSIKDVINKKYPEKIKLDVYNGIVI